MNNLDITRTFLARNDDEVAAQKLATLFDAIDEIVDTHEDMTSKDYQGVSILLMSTILRCKVILSSIREPYTEKQEAEDITKLHDLIQQHPTEAKYYLDNMEVDS